VGSIHSEINVFSPGGPRNPQQLERVNFNRSLRGWLQEEVDYNRYDRRRFCNGQIATP